eukprot:gnl/TRDRNA2_/TRDRNA2_128561_c1_seq1.p1 gnl/TRDRNA2_/TRDRNA2_128561_c1~~gnl/TRDRNA2_/TRDRNA2_128561_c1_seq1.p1  ORF type:complete len:185 (-),score=30.61 gnl/TRDRNA2_/TRDRNA2_128561_c1_seq1:30-584(-)
MEESIRLHRASRGKDLAEQAKGKLQVAVTHFDPLPRTAIVAEFANEQELVTSVLASCYIPVAYEEPIRLRGLNLCIDGCAINFFPSAKFVVSPYHCHLADIEPVAEYPRTMVFNLLHGDDILRLFEDGYLDTVRWLQEGTRSREKLRTAAWAGAPAKTSVIELLRQGILTVIALAGFERAKRRS